MAAPFLAAAAPTANLAVLDRKELEAMVLGSPAEPPHCADAAVSARASGSKPQRAKHLRHVLAAAHELLVRSAAGRLIGRFALNQPSVLREYLKVHLAGAEHNRAGLRAQAVIDQAAPGIGVHTYLGPVLFGRRADFLRAARLAAARSWPAARCACAFCQAAIAAAGKSAGQRPSRIRRMRPSSGFL